MLCSSASGSVMQCTEHQVRKAPASACTAWVLPVPGGPYPPEDQGAAARPAGREEARHRRAHRDRVVARDLRPLRHGDRPADVGPAVAGRRPEPHRHAVVRDRLGPQRLREALARAADVLRVTPADDDVAVRGAPGEQGDAAVVEGHDGGVRASHRPGARPGPRRSGRRGRRPSRGTSVMCTCTRPRCSIAARKTCSTSGLTRTSVVSPDSSVRVVPAAGSSGRSSGTTRSKIVSLSAGTGMSARAGGIEPPPSPDGTAAQGAAGE